VVRSPREEVWTGGVRGIFESLRRGIVSLTPSVGDIALLVLRLGFVAFAVEWFLLIFK